MGQTTEDLKAQIADQRDTLGRDLEAIGDRVSPSRMAQRRKAAVREHWQSTKNRVMGSADTATNKLSDAASGMGEAVTSVPQRAAGVAEGNPLAVGLIAFGAGLVVATLLPETEREKKLAAKVQPTIEHAASEVGASAQGAIEQMKPAVQEAVDEVKSSTRESAQQVKEHATDAASQTAADAKQTAQDAQPTR